MNTIPNQYNTESIQHRINALLAIIVPQISRPVKYNLKSLAHKVAINCNNNITRFIATLFIALLTNDFILNRKPAQIMCLAWDNIYPIKQIAFLIFE